MNCRAASRLRAQPHWSQIAPETRRRLTKAMAEIADVVQLGKVLRAKAKVIRHPEMHAPPSHLTWAQELKELDALAADTDPDMRAEAEAEIMYLLGNGS
jgi:hypothetical protein